MDKIKLVLDFSHSGFPENITLTDALRILHELGEKPIVLVVDEAQHALTSGRGMFCIMNFCFV